MKAAALWSFAAALMLAATASACGESPAAQGRPTPEMTTPRIVTTSTPSHTPRAVPATSPQPTPSPSVSASVSASVSPSAVPGRGTVVGRVLAGPTCPVITAEKPCPPRPVQALVAARDAAGRTIGSTTTARDGRFALTLPKGAYSLVATTRKALPRCPKARVSVRSSRQVQTTISCDTGIR